MPYLPISRKVARDGEGARKLVEIVVGGRGLKSIGSAYRRVDCQFTSREGKMPTGVAS